MKLSRYALLLAMLWLSSCATSCGCLPEPDELKIFTVGQTNIQDIKGKFGLPDTTTTNAEGVTTLTYIYYHEKPIWENSIIFIGVFIGGFDKISQQDNFVFDANGKLKSYVLTRTINGKAAESLTAP